jgi:hypothetical protein
VSDYIRKDTGWLAVSYRSFEVAIALIILLCQDRDPPLSTFYFRALGSGRLWCGHRLSVSHIMCGLSSITIITSFPTVQVSLYSRQVWVNSRFSCCFVCCTVAQWLLRSSTTASPSSRCTAALAAGVKISCAGMVGVSLLCYAFIMATCTLSSNGHDLPSKEISHLVLQRL